MRRSLFRAVLLTACLAPACAEPPNKEINQAQGAIDAARAAGAERWYATSELSSANTSLANAGNAVTQGDYRLALNYALESREHAQNAARDAANNRARLRSEVERTLADIEELATRANRRLTEAQRARVSRQTLNAAREAVSQAATAVQEASAAATADDYAGAQALLTGVKERIENALASLEGPAKSQSLRRRR